jgi:SOS-response transcriptional repressor LexA
MIVYENRLSDFINDVDLNKISDILEKNLHDKHIGGGSPAEVNAWNNSLHFMKDVLNCSEIPNDCKVAIEYNIPQTSKRVDFMIIGADRDKKDHIVIVELKQWAQVQKVDNWSKHSVLSDLRSHQPTPHPSYQAFSYKSLILNYCDVDDLCYDSLSPCAYLHNMSEGFRDVLEDQLYHEWVREAPVFLKGDVIKLRSFIQRYIMIKSSNDDLLYKIDFGRLKPTKSLQDSLDSMLCGNEEFKMIDEQVVAYDYIMDAIRKSQSSGKKHVIIIQGGPGTGKSVLAINVLVDCIRKLELNASYVTKNSAPRECYTKLLSKGNARKELDLKLAICSPFSLPNTPNNGLDVGIFDEAHRMVKKPYMYSGEDMLRDAIAAAKTSVFFVDDDQRITTKDIYTTDTIISYAKEAGAVLSPAKPYILSSQFRCNGSDGYISFLDNILNLKKTANTTLDTAQFDFRVYDSPQEMKDALLAADAGQNKSRMCAGYCYDWNVKNGRGDWDVVIGSFRAKWNLENDKVFAVNPDSFNEIGCIHTVQGMEFNYVGVIIGKDLIYRDGVVKTDQTAISKDDKTSGIRTCKDKAVADKLIRNTYRVLMTRGLKGCFVYCEDKALSNYLHSWMPDMQQEEDDKLVYLPVVGEIAAGHEHFMDEEIITHIGVEPSELNSKTPGKYFFLKVSGDSMIGADINDGDAVLIRKMSNPKWDIKNGDVVACMIHGDRATLKSYFRTESGVLLHPENPEYDDIFIPYEEFMSGEARIIGKMTAVYEM